LSITVEVSYIGIMLTMPDSIPYETVSCIYLNMRVHFVIVLVLHTDTLYVTLGPSHVMGTFP